VWGEIIDIERSDIVIDIEIERSDIDIDIEIERSDIDIDIDIERSDIDIDIDIERSGIDIDISLDPHPNDQQSGGRSRARYREDGTPPLYRVAPRPRSAARDRRP
jgi:hypothetical protein